MLYGASQRLAPFVETLARFRPSFPVQAVASTIRGPVGNSAVQPGEVRAADWVLSRSIGTARVGGAFADVGHSTSLAFLREQMAARLTHYRVEELDAAAIRQTAPRRFTQEISRLVFEVGMSAGEPIAGLYYRSKWGDELENWAVFETAAITRVDRWPPPSIDTWHGANRGTTDRPPTCW